MNYKACFVILIHLMCLENVILQSSENVEERSVKFLQKLQKVNVDPDVYLDSAQIIKRHGYPSETHVVVTEDGYILRLHRIPGNKNGELGGQPVLLLHALLGSSTHWLELQEKSLAFLLADSGYDVWLGNARGNTYSKGHMTLSVDSPQYWNFSFHEMGVYDLPAMVNYINNVTLHPNKILYVGHSMGCTMFFVFASCVPEIARKVELMVALAPGVYMTHLSSPIRYLIPFVNEVEWLAKHLGVNEVLPSNKLLKKLGLECSLKTKDGRICRNLLFSLFGFDEQQIELDTLEIVLTHEPSGASTKTVLHFAQEVKEGGRFQQYDYGPNENMIAYGKKTPPQYNLGNVKVPTFLMYGPADTIVSPIDVKRLDQTLTRNTGLYEVPLSNFDHLDFIYGKNATNLVYQPLLQVLRNSTDLPRFEE